MAVILTNILILTYILTKGVFHSFYWGTLGPTKISKAELPETIALMEAEPLA